MYRDFHEKEWVPVFLDGEKISDIPVLKNRTTHKKEFSRQYEGNMYEHFCNLIYLKRFCYWIIGIE